MMCLNCVNYFWIFFVFFTYIHANFHMGPFNFVVQRFTNVMQQAGTTCSICVHT